MLDPKLRTENKVVQALYETSICNRARQLLAQARKLIDEDFRFLLRRENIRAGFRLDEYSPRQCLSRDA